MSVDVRTEWAPSIYYAECDEAYNGGFGGGRSSTEACQQIQNLSEYHYVYPFNHESGDDRPYVALESNEIEVGPGDPNVDLEALFAYRYVSSNYSSYARGSWGDGHHPLFNNYPTSWLAFKSKLSFLYYEPIPWGSQIIGIEVQIKVLNHYQNNNIESGTHKLHGNSEFIDPSDSIHKPIKITVGKVKWDELTGEEGDNSCGVLWGSSRYSFAGVSSDTGTTEKHSDWNVFPGGPDATNTFDAQLADDNVPVTPGGEGGPGAYGFSAGWPAYTTYTLGGGVDTWGLEFEKWIEISTGGLDKDSGWLALKMEIDLQDDDSNDLVGVDFSNPALEIGGVLVRFTYIPHDYELKIYEVPLSDMLMPERSGEMSMSLPYRQDSMLLGTNYDWDENYGGDSYEWGPYVDVLKFSSFEEVYNQGAYTVPGEWFQNFGYPVAKFAADLPEAYSPGGLEWEQPHQRAEEKAERHFPSLPFWDKSISSKYCWACDWEHSLQDRNNFRTVNPDLAYLSTVVQLSTSTDPYAYKPFIKPDFIKPDMYAMTQTVPSAYLQHARTYISGWGLYTEFFPNLVTDLNLDQTLEGGIGWTIDTKRDASMSVSAYSGWFQTSGAGDLLEACHSWKYGFLVNAFSIPNINRNKCRDTGGQWITRNCFWLDKESCEALNDIQPENDGLDTYHDVFHWLPGGALDTSVRYSAEWNDMYGGDDTAYYEDNYPIAFNPSMRAANAHIVEEEGLFHTTTWIPDIKWGYSGGYCTVPEGIIPVTSFQSKMTIVECKRLRDEDGLDTKWVPGRLERTTPEATALLWDVLRGHGAWTVTNTAEGFSRAHSPVKSFSKLQGAEIAVVGSKYYASDFTMCFGVRATNQGGYWGGLPSATDDGWTSSCFSEGGKLLEPQNMPTIEESRLALTVDLRKASEVGFLPETDIDHDSVNHPYSLVAAVLVIKSEQAAEVKGEAEVDGDDGLDLPYVGLIRTAWGNWSDTGEVVYGNGLSDYFGRMFVYDSYTASNKHPFSGDDFTVKGTANNVRSMFGSLALEDQIELRQSIYDDQSAELDPDKTNVAMSGNWTRNMGNPYMALPLDWNIFERLKLAWKSATSRDSSRADSMASISILNLSSLDNVPFPLRSTEVSKASKVSSALLQNQAEGGGFGSTASTTVTASDEINNKINMFSLLDENANMLFYSIEPLDPTEPEDDTGKDLKSIMDVPDHTPFGTMNLSEDEYLVIASYDTQYSWNSPVIGQAGSFVAVSESGNATSFDSVTGLMLALESTDGGGNLSEKFEGIEEGDYLWIISKNNPQQGYGVYEIIETNAIMNWVADYDNNLYETVRIGEQTWMADSLKTVHYNDGSEIQNVQSEDVQPDVWEYLSTGAYTYNDFGEHTGYENDSFKIYGNLYNWFTIEDAASKEGICPDGFHVPSDEEFMELEMYLGMSEEDTYGEEDRGGYPVQVGAQLAGTANLWYKGSGVAEESTLENISEFGTSGFNAIPAGYRHQSGPLYSKDEGFALWTASENESETAWYRSIGNNDGDVGRATNENSQSKKHGRSIRCMKLWEEPPTTTTYNVGLKLIAYDNSLSWPESELPQEFPVDIYIARSKKGWGGKNLTLEYTQGFAQQKTAVDLVISSNIETVDTTSSAGWKYSCAEECHTNIGTGLENQEECEALPNYKTDDIYPFVTTNHSWWGRCNFNKLDGRPYLNLPYDSRMLTNADPTVQERTYVFWMKGNISTPLSSEDYDGNVYENVRIGNQVWMVENLKVTHYNNGDEIPTGLSSGTSGAGGEWATTTEGAYAVYPTDDDDASEATCGDDCAAVYGNLYNWFAVDDDRGICPDGFHVATDDDFKETEMYLGMSEVEADSTGERGTNEGSKLAGNYDLWTGIHSAGDLVNNSEFGTSGFTFLPNGYRAGSDGDYFRLASYGYLWSSTSGVDADSESAYIREPRVGITEMSRWLFTKNYGKGVRCVKRNILPHVLAHGEEGMGDIVLHRGQEHIVIRITPEKYTNHSTPQVLDGYWHHYLVYTDNQNPRFPKSVYGWNTNKPRDI